MLGEFLGLMKLSKKGANMLRNRYEELEKSLISEFNENRTFAFGYIVDIIQDMINQGTVVNSVEISGNWCEIDTLQDLDNAKNKFSQLKFLRFNIFNFENSKNLSNIRLTLDTEEDFELIKSIYDALFPSKPIFSWNDVVSFLQSNPHLLEINKDIKKSGRYQSENN